MSGLQDRLLDRLQSELRKVRIERDTLAEEVKQLRTAFAPRRCLPMEWKLTPQEQRLFLMLADREFCDRAMLTEGIRKSRDVDGTKLVDVVIHKLRKKMTPRGLVIETIHGCGFRMQDRPRWRALIGGNEATVLGVAA